MTLDPSQIAEKLSELAGRAEKAGRGDRDLELAVWRATDPSAAAVEAEGKTPLPWLHCYTTSLDAAMSLVPEGARWSLEKMAGPRSMASVHVDKRGPTEVLESADHFHASAATPALALTAASLRARAMENNNE